MKRNDIRGLMLFFLAVLMLWFLIFPSQSGWLGGNVRLGFFYVFGKVVSYIFPIIVGWLGIKLIINRKAKTVQKGAYHLLPDLFFIWSLCVFFYLAAVESNLGGCIGQYTAIGIEKVIGVFGSWVLSLGTILITGLIITGVHFSAVINRVSGMLTPGRKRAGDDAESRQPQPAKVIIPKPPEINQKPPEIHIPEKAKPAAAPIVRIQKEHIPTKETPREVLQANHPQQQKTGAAKYILPSIDLLDKPKAFDVHLIEKELQECGERLIKALSNFNITAAIDCINPGPVITRYDIVLAAGIKVSSILNLSNDISLAMKTASVRVLAPIPGKAAIGIEIPNPKPATVSLSEIIATKEFAESKSLLTFAIGKTVPGEPFSDNLVSMPHLLIAGTTGSGKSICLHSIIMSLLFRASPKELKFLMIDPKQLELPVYNDLPHLIDPIIKDSKMAVAFLNALVKIMEERYKHFAAKTVRNIDGYNALMEKTGQEKMYYIVVIIDELADLMLITKNEVEESIRRLSSMARAVGIHLILATQRPSVDVITGVIKANLPSRIALQVLSKTDSRVILDCNGAEDLIGRGDMLYLQARYPKPVRMQGSYVSEAEIERVVNFIKKQQPPEYQNIIVKTEATEKKEISEKEKEELTAALTLILERRKVSYDILKSNGFGNRAADILSRLELSGFINKPEGTNRWTIYTEKIEDFLKKPGAA